MSKIPVEFYQREDVLRISRELLGKYLFTFIDDRLTGGMIVETEAYMAPEDKASHAFNNRRTLRTEPIYKAGGISYVYLCYGIHSLFNVITGGEDMPHAILIRALEPTEGIETMLQRRNKNKIDYGLTAGPGAMSVALGITTRHNGASLNGDTIWLEDRKVNFPSPKIIASPRVGVSYAQEYASKPWRFRVLDSPWVSKAK